MRLKLYYFYFLFCFVLFSYSPSALLAATRRPIEPDTPNINTPTNNPFVPDEIIVKFKDDQIDLESLGLIAKLKEWTFTLNNNLESRQELVQNNAIVYKIKNGKSVSQMLADLKNDPKVDYAEPNYIRSSSTISTDDTHKAKLWGLDNTGQTLTLSDGSTATGTVDADIDIPEAWNISLGTTEIIVAIIDTGVAYTHPDLLANMWDGTTCKDENGSALGDCIHGYDYESNDKNPIPSSSSHGTHVAGTIGAVRDNAKGVLGVAPKIRIMAIKCDLTTACLVKSLDFARHNGAKVVNASYGGVDFSQSEYDSIERFQSAGGIFVAAAGNDATNNESIHNYPSDYDLSNIIAVAATYQTDSLASFSNYGTTSVDIAAPGENIYSTWDETNIINLTFDDLTELQIPSTWTSDAGSTWGAYDLGIGVTDFVIYGDMSLPYQSSINSVITSGTINLTTYTNAKFDFLTRCDTEMTDPDTGGDYMALEASSNGTDFTELERWNRYNLYQLSGNYNTYNMELTLAGSYLTSSFKYRFRWVTDADADKGVSGDGCFIDDLKIVTYTDGSDEQYGYADGTSMATPHVVGLAAYLWSLSPGTSYPTIISYILNNGDTLASLSSKLVTGRRINVYNSILALAGVGPVISGVSNDTTPAKTKSWIWTSDNPSADLYRYSIDQISDSTPSGTYDAGTSASVTSGNGTYYLHIQGKNSFGIEGTIKTVSCILDNAGPLPVIGTNGTTTFVAVFNEALYDNLGATIPPATNLTSRFTSTSEIGITSVILGTTDATFTVSSPYAGSIISLNNTDADRFYDNLGNGSTTINFTYNGSGWLVNPTSLNVAITNIGDLITTNNFVLAAGTSAASTTKITLATNIILDLGGSSSVNLPQSLEITENSDQNYNANLLQGAPIDTSLISNFIGGYSPQSAIQWGIPNVTLKFSTPITVSIYVGSSLNGQTLNIYRSSSLSSGWTSTGIVSPASCVVSSGICQFTATQASYYTASSPSPTSASSTSSSSNSFSSSGPPSGPQCQAKTPSGIPDLFAIKAEKGKVTLYFTPINGVSGYSIIYGFKKDDQRFATIVGSVHNNQGEQSAIINKLNPKSTYYFRVAAVNDCTAGLWSDWLPVKADKKQMVYRYKTLLKNKKPLRILNIFK